MYPLKLNSAPVNLCFGCRFGCSLYEPSTPPPVSFAVCHSTVCGSLGGTQTAHRAVCISQAAARHRAEWLARLRSGQRAELAALRAVERRAHSALAAHRRRRAAHRSARELRRLQRDGHADPQAAEVLAWAEAEARLALEEDCDEARHLLGLRGGLAAVRWLGRGWDAGSGPETTGAADVADVEGEELEEALLQAVGHAEGAIRLWYTERQDEAGRWAAGTDGPDSAVGHQELIVRRPALCTVALSSQVLT